jgi:putative nucleotidyltransferase with HDIG domain
MPTREDAWKLLCQYTESQNLRRHALGVEACVRAYARKFNENEDLWGLAGLLHDFDYERWPNTEHSPSAGHPAQGSEILRQFGYPQEVVHAILSHADYTGASRSSLLDRALFACDELSGFLVACALVKPSRSLLDVAATSVKKKLKDKAFARGVNRQDITQGAQELGISLDDHINFCIQAMQSIASEIGLDGTGGK